MEQKQLDELDESYFGEEFVDDDSFETINLDESSEAAHVEKGSVEKGSLDKKSNEKALREEAIMEKVEGSKGEDQKKKTIRKRSTKNTELEKKNKSSVSNADEKWTSKEELVRDDSSLGEKKQPEVSDSADKKEKVAKKGSKSSSRSAIMETSKPVNPWEDENSDNNKSGLFAGTSAWKFITAVMVVLLIISVFTQGFNFSEDKLTGAAVAGKDLTLEQAQKRVLDYVNTNLLRPPYIAKAVSSAELDDVFRITLSIADQEVDAYLTKDGRYFFPQGFDVSFQLVAEEVEAAQATPTEGILEKVEKTPEEESLKEKTAADAVEEAPVVTGRTQTFSLTAKKWLFSPQKLEVKAGDTVVLTIEPEGLDFTFSITDLGVEQAVSGTTTVEFTADKSGEFEFSCSSCESWRGMIGVLVVK